MTFLVVDKVLLTCSYGTCSSKLKVTPLKLPPMSVGVSLPAVGVGVGIEVGAGVGAGLGAGMGAGLSLPNGPVKTFNAAGNLVAQANFQAGIPVGESLAYDAAGQVTQKLMFVAGKVHGMASMYVDGVLTAAMNFKHGLMHGVSKFYDLQGRLAMQTNYAGGVEAGMRVTFNVETGTVLQQEQFVNGLLGGVVDAALQAEGALEAQIGGAIGAGLGLVPTGALALGAELAGSVASVAGNDVATIMDHVPYVNISPFCYCKSRSNPAVAAATKKARGKLTPQPCTPKTMSPWVPGSHNATLVGYPALTHPSKLICAYAGVIHVRDPGQKKVSVP